MTESAQQEAALQGCARALAKSGLCPLNTPLPTDWTFARYQADRSAFIHRFHDPALQQRLRPNSPRLATALAELEKLRCMLLGAQHLSLIHI